ncbi:LytTR family DNA-binding domain-containing protein [Cellulophaga sp. 20_2_10]|uniref:LytR/AlgR family response regulator transcription factor n=1 Tax=Cellulophaga sp. 20_2_10 TaxID=2942476 RepID=UPI00201AAF27|nr:LytTR family DNA-binding domain-containing protein [Cellulophaga sp. 20_2_10]MCL5247249.1 LytTR family DNA-binding domain-containing protein [Cellulophaga sp. 20_2_10]
MNIKCLVIDDEPSSQHILKKFIDDVDFLELIDVCNSANDALIKLKEHIDIDVLFLDINMPKISGLSFYKSLRNPPEVIFTTAYSQYAIDGFEVNAIDYLLKPFSFDRFLIAVNKLDKKKEDLETTIPPNDFLLIKSNKVLHKILLTDIIFLEAAGDYVKIYLEDKYITTNTTFGNMLDSLPKRIFVRTHKSFAVNFKEIKSISGNLIITTNHKIPIGQKYKAEFLEFLDINESNKS